MKAFKIIAGMVVVAATVVAVNTATAGATANNTTTCDIPKLALGEPAGKNMKVEGNKVTATFTVTGTNCTTPVTLAVWKTPSANGQPINDQVFFGHTTQTYGPGVHTISANIPDCYWQADLLVGDKPKAADGTANYAYQNGKILTVHPLRDFKFGGDKKCTEQPKTPEQPKGGAGEGGPEEVAATVTEMPKTGAGAMAATFAGVTASAGIAHAIVNRFKRNK